jgi:small subunit ribosomal protein S8
MNIETINFLSQLKNASLVRKGLLQTNSNKLIKSLMKILYREGFILSFRNKLRKKFNNGTLDSIVNLKYFDNETIFSSLCIVSTPSNTRFLSIKDICRINSKKNLFIFSTNKGLLTLTECKKQHLGGVLLFVC